MLIHDPRNQTPIDTLYAWLSRDENDNEGIIAAPIRGNITPLVVGKYDLALVLAPLARTVVSMGGTGKTAHLARFTRAGDILL